MQPSTSKGGCTDLHLPDLPLGKQSLQSLQSLQNILIPLFVIKLEDSPITIHKLKVDVARRQLIAIRLHQASWVRLPNTVDLQAPTLSVRLTVQNLAGLCRQLPPQVNDDVVRLRVRNHPRTHEPRRGIHVYIGSIYVPPTREPNHLLDAYQPS